ncbi:MAG: AAA family ATPase [Draconibacterium sp.]|nr:AAA family ATPase [Draconibacterium sp.]
MASVELSQRYISDRFLPDKAIDLMDEAAAKLRLEIDSVPEELDEVERRVKQLEIEREAIKREKDINKLESLNKEISELKEEQSTLRAKWQMEKSVIEAIQKKKAEIEEYKFEAEESERQGDYEHVAELRYGRVKEAEHEIVKLQAEFDKLKEGDNLIKEEVDVEDIAEVVARWTGIPVTKMLQSEREKLLQMEDELHKRVIGQEEAITAISDAVRRSRAGLQDENRPIGSFIFLGSTGVGKTELAKALAEYLFDDENMITRIDMSEYQEKFSVTRLIGSPPGYVGYDEGGQLTEAVRHKPYSVVLLDEIEKAHPDVFNVFLQVLDDGRLTDNKGRTINFKNTIIIMTSNLGAEIIQQNMDNLNAGNQNEIMEKTQMQLLEMLRKTIRPEFLNRIDDTIVFTPLSKKDITKVVKLQFEKVVTRIASTNMKIEITESAINWLAEMGYDPHFGARPVKRVLQKYVLNELSKKILAGDVQKERPIIIDISDDGLIFKN